MLVLEWVLLLKSKHLNDGIKLPIAHIHLLISIHRHPHSIGSLVRLPKSWACLISDAFLEVRFVQLLVHGQAAKRLVFLLLFVDLEVVLLLL